MESTQSIKSRIKSVTSTEQITKAMGMVASNKMRKSQVHALDSRPFAIAGMEILREITKRTPHVPELMKSKEKTGKTLIVLIASDKGLAGSFNSNVFRKFEKTVNGNKEDYLYAAVGKKAEDYITRKNYDIQKSFIKFGDYAAPEQTQVFADFIIDGFLENKWSKVITLSTHFRTTLRQDVLSRELLPITFQNLEADINELVPEYGKYSENNAKKNGNGHYEYRIEPKDEIGAHQLLNDLTKHLVEMVLYHLILESNASEHSARMVAMKSASDNAGELKDNLLLIYNKSRQAAITQELAEITAGANTNI